MKFAVQWIAIVLLLAVYGAAGWAVLHPRVSPEYRAYFIDHTMTDYMHYDSTPEQGMTFNRPGLPQWVWSTRGLSVRDDWGRWTDSDLALTAGLTFAHAFDGDVCLDFTARAVPWIVGQDIEVKMGSEQQPFRVSSEGLSEYRLQFEGLHGAKDLDFVLPPHLPPVKERAPQNPDTRRLGINLSLLRLIPGACSTSAKISRLLPAYETLGNGVIHGSS